MHFKTNNDLIRQIEKNTGLEFLEKEMDGNLCFAQNNFDLRDEFKSGFSFSDFIYFLKNFSEKSLIIPSEAATFWELVEKGKNI
ncbi:hypothetical protein [Moheibacter sp.]|uniref:hypothetical protein n=1 Tax=Moheibacter sp. TaxID=1965316 RepID=UPI003C743B93